MNVPGLLIGGQEKKEKLDNIDLSHEKGTKDFLIYNDSDIIKKLSSFKNIESYAIVPDVSSYVRDMTKHGMVGMGIRKIKSLGLFNLLRISLSAITKIRKILKQDFKVLLPILVKVDYLELKKLKPNHVFLHYQMTDLALANDNKELISKFLSLNLGSAKLGLMTQNLSLLEEKLEKWGLNAASILAPFNYNGFAMRNSKEECEKMVKTKNKNYFSFTFTSNANLANELNYLQNIGLKRNFILIKD